MNTKSKKLDLGAMMSILGLALILGMSSLLGGCDWFDIGGDNTTEGEWVQMQDWRANDIANLEKQEFSFAGEGFIIISKESGSRLLYQLGTTQKKVTSSDALTEYTFGDNGTTVGSYSYFNFAYWSSDDNAVTLAALDWSKARVGSVELTLNSSIAPYLEHNNSRITTSYMTLSSGAIISIKAATNGAGVYAIWRFIPLVGGSVSVPTDTDWNSATYSSSGSLDVPVSFSGGGYFILFAREKDPGKGWSSVVRLDVSESTTTTTTVPAATTWPFAVSFSPAGGRPLFIKRLSTMSTTSTAAETICDGVIQTSVNLKAGWYRIGAGSSTVGWLQDGIFRLTLGSITSPASLSGFMLDNENHYQWFVTVKNDGTMVNGLVTL